MICSPRRTASQQSRLELQALAVTRRLLFRIISMNSHPKCQRPCGLAIVGVAMLGLLAVAATAWRTAPRPEFRVSALPTAGNTSGEIKDAGQWPRVAVTAEGQLGPGEGTLLVQILPPADGTLTAGAPLRVQAWGDGLEFPAPIRENLDPASLPLHLPIRVSDGATGPARLRLSYYYCTHGHSASCRPERVELVVNLDLSGPGPGGEAIVRHRASER